LEEGGWYARSGKKMGQKCLVQKKKGKWSKVKWEKRPGLEKRG